jgi:hypothetical protein
MRSLWRAIAPPLDEFSLGDRVYWGDADGLIHGAEIFTLNFRNLFPLGSVKPNQGS